MLSQRRLFLVGAILCLLIAAVAGMHVGGHDDAANVCGLAGLACALVVALVAPLRIRAAVVRLCAPVRRSTRTYAATRDVSARPSALGLAELCCLRVTS